MNPPPAQPSPPPAAAAAAAPAVDPVPPPQATVGETLFGRKTVMEEGQVLIPEMSPSEKARVEEAKVLADQQRTKDDKKRAQQLRERELAKKQEEARQAELLKEKKARADIALKQKKKWLGSVKFGKIERPTSKNTTAAKTQTWKNYKNLDSQRVNPSWQIGQIQIHLDTNVPSVKPNRQGIVTRTVQERLTASTLGFKEYGFSAPYFSPRIPYHLGNIFFRNKSYDEKCRTFFESTVFRDFLNKCCEGLSAAELEKLLSDTPEEKVFENGGTAHQNVQFMLMIFFKKTHYLEETIQPVMLTPNAFSFMSTVSDMFRNLGGWFRPNAAKSSSGSSSTSDAAAAAQNDVMNSKHCFLNIKGGVNASEEPNKTRGGLSRYLFLEATWRNDFLSHPAYAEAFERYVQYQKQYMQIRDNIRNVLMNYYNKTIRQTAVHYYYHPDIVNQIIFLIAERFERLSMVKASILNVNPQDLDYGNTGDSAEWFGGRRVNYIYDYWSKDQQEERDSFREFAKNNKLFTDLSLQHALARIEGYRHYNTKLTRIFRYIKTAMLNFIEYAYRYIEKQEAWQTFMKYKRNNWTKFEGDKHFHPELFRFIEKLDVCDTDGTSRAPVPYEENNAGSNKSPTEITGEMKAIADMPKEDPGAEKRGPPLDAMDFFEESEGFDPNDPVAAAKAIRAIETAEIQYGDYEDDTDGESESESDDNDDDDQKKKEKKETEKEDEPEKEKKTLPVAAKVKQCLSAEKVYEQGVYVGVQRRIGTPVMYDIYLQLNVSRVPMEDSQNSNDPEKKGEFFLTCKYRDEELGNLLLAFFGRKSTNYRYFYDATNHSSVRIERPLWFHIESTQSNNNDDPAAAGEKDGNHRRFDDKEDWERRKREFERKNNYHEENRDRYRGKYYFGGHRLRNSSPKRRRNQKTLFSDQGSRKKKNFSKNN